MESLLLKLDELKEKYKNYPNKFDTLGYIIFKRTYARTLGNRKEEWFETVYRCIKSLIEDVKVDYSEKEIERLYQYHMDLKCSFAGRQLWQLGSKLVKKGYADSLYNCYFFEMNNMNSFLQIFDELMLGGGCGFGVQKRFIKMLPDIKDCNIVFNNELDVKENLTPEEHEFGYYDEKENTFFVGDSREGWVILLDNILSSYFYNEKSFTVNTNMIRKYGEPIKGFGGVASGDKQLIEGFSEIISILKSKAGFKLSSVDILDIVCLIASVVVSGNVRRSATIAIGDSDDIEFLQCKRWDMFTIPYYRSFVNISIESKEFPISNYFWDTYKKDTEAIGLVNMFNCKTYGRLGINKHLDREFYIPIHGEKAMSKDFMLDRNVSGVNPCGEITLEHAENCLLSEIVLPNVENYNEFIDICKLLYKANKNISQMNFLYQNTQDVNRKNSRIGISITGILDSYDKFNSWTNCGYKDLREFDTKYSRKKGLLPSIKLTTIQPHGTKSLMFNVSHGLHPQYSEYYYRTIRFSANDELLKTCKEMNLKIENAMFYQGKDKDGKDIIKENKDTKVVYFPRKAKETSIISENLSSIEHLNMVISAQEKWADNSTSVTVYYEKKYLNEIKEHIRNNWSNLKTVSLLPKTHGFLQAPYIPISEQEYNQYVNNIKDINISINSNDIIDNIECEGGHCPVR